jgi:type VI secretion system protein ImpA
MPTQFETEIERLEQPLSGARPCGIDLEDTSELTELESQRVFGLLTASQVEPDWSELRSRALQVLNRSKDLRALAHFTAAMTRTGTLPDVLRTCALLEPWLTRYWDDLHPRVAEDAIARRNALNCFADRVAIVDPLRRLPLFSHPQLGAFSLRDIDIAAGVQPNPDADYPPRTETEVSAALQEADISEVRALYEGASLATQALNGVQEIMRSRSGDAGIPELEPLTRQLSRIQKLVSFRIESEPSGTAGAASSFGDAVQTTQARGAAGGVTSRHDAIRALEAVADYFRRNEPSSPVPLVIERAKRMVSMDFLAVLAELAPEALEQARRATGVQKTD